MELAVGDLPRNHGLNVADQVPSLVGALLQHFDHAAIQPVDILAG